MSKKKEKPLFNIVYVTDEDIKKQREKQISELNEEQKSEFFFSGEHLYKVGVGHDFLYGFYTEFITKSGVVAVFYDYNQWHIGSDEFIYKDNQFIKKERPAINTEPINWENLSFPVVKQVAARTWADSIKSEKPRNK